MSDNQDKGPPQVGRQLRKTTVLQRDTRRPPPKKSRRKPTQPRTPPASSNMSAAIPADVLAALTPTKKAALEAWAACHTAPIHVNIPTVKVKQINNQVKVPKYDALKKNAVTYLDELESYFKSQTLEEKDFLDSIPAVVDDEIKSWYRHQKKTGYTWANFKTDFKARYDSAVYKQQRIQYLVTRKQKEGEAVDTFIWEMMDLAKQVFPTEDTAVSLERCRMALLPKLKANLSALTGLTPDKLIERCTVVMQDLRELEVANRQSGNSYNSHNHVQNRGSYRGHYGRWQRGFHQNNFSRRPYVNESSQYQSNGQQQQPQSISSQAIQGSSSSNDRGGYNSKKIFRQQTRGIYGRQQPGQGPGPSNPHLNTKCYTCKKIGHIAAQCPVTAFFADGDREEEDTNPAADVMDLNRQGGQ